MSVSRSAAAGWSPRQGPCFAIALGGDCLADVGMLRAEPAVFGPVASDPKVSRLIGRLAAGGQRVLAALRMARAEVREHVWKLAGDAAPGGTPAKRYRRCGSPAGWYVGAGTATPAGTRRSVRS